MALVVESCSNSHHFGGTESVLPLSTGFKSCSAAAPKEQW